MTELDRDREKVLTHLRRFLPETTLLSRKYDGKECVAVAVRARKGDYNYGVLRLEPTGRPIRGLGLHGLYVAGGRGWHERMAIVLIRVSGWGGLLPWCSLPSHRHRHRCASCSS